MNSANENASAGIKRNKENEANNNAPLQLALKLKTQRVEVNDNVELNG